MAPRSGKFGTVNGHTSVFNWELNDDSSPEIFRASNTRNGQFVKAGIEDWSGSFSGFGGLPTVLPGETFTFEGYTAPGTGVFGNDGKVYTGSAIVSSASINWQWQPSQSLSWTVNFEAASGTLAESDDAFDDTTLELPDKMCNLVIDVGASAAEVAWADVVSAVLNITSENQVVVNSSTSCATNRDPGAISWNLAVTDQQQTQGYAKGADHRIRIFTNATLFWLMEWAHLQSYTGLVVDRQGGGIIQKTANFVMQGSDGTTIGALAKPGGTNFWPPVFTVT